MRKKKIRLCFRFFEVPLITDVEIEEYKNSPYSDIPATLRDWAGDDKRRWISLLLSSIERGYAEETYAFVPKKSVVTVAIVNNDIFSSHPALISGANIYSPWPLSIRLNANNEEDDEFSLLLARIKALGINNLEGSIIESPVLSACGSVKAYADEMLEVLSCYEDYAVARERGNKIFSTAKVRVLRREYAKIC